MARLACASVPALPLQLLLREHPDWRGFPAAVVADERAQSRLLWINAAAWRAGVRTGMRHAAALALSHELRAGVVPAGGVAAELRALTARLQRHSPHVEPSREEPGVFWLQADGLRRLHPELRPWAQGVAAELQAAGLQAAVVVGHNRFTAYAAARVTPVQPPERGVAVFADAAQERRAVRRVPLGALGIAPDVRDTLAQLGIHTLAGLLRLPPLGLLQRFGAPLYRLHRLAAGALVEGLQPVPEALPVQAALLLDDAETDLARLLFGLKSRLSALLGELGARRQALKALHLRLLLAGARPVETVLRPAAPTRDPALLLDLLRLRLESLALEAAVSGIELLAEGETRELAQLPLFPAPEVQELEAANRALARLRAEFGEGAVVRARLADAHLPEAAFAWEPLDALKMPATTGQVPQRPPPPVLVRRLHAAPQALDVPPGPLPPAALQRSLERALGCGALARLHGPYPLSGAWWAGALHRDYYFAETRRGDLLWLYHDRRHPGWHLQGRVE
jgi:protein ImuB